MNTPDAFGFAPTDAPLTYAMGAIEGGGILVRSMHGGKLGLSHIARLRQADAVPALLAALEDAQRILFNVGWPERFGKEREAVRAAIAAAKGEA